MVYQFLLSVVLMLLLSCFLTPILHPVFSSSSVSSLPQWGFLCTSRHFYRCVYSCIWSGKNLKYALDKIHENNSKKTEQNVKIFIFHLILVVCQTMSTTNTHTYTRTTFLISMYVYMYISVCIYVALFLINKAN